MPPTKPATWAVNRAEVDPAWEWAWQELGHLAGYSEGSGHPSDIVNGTFATGTFNGWEITAEGIGPNRNVTTQTLVFPDRPGFQLLGDVEFTVGILCDATTQNGAYIAARDDTDNGMWELINASGNVSFDWRVGGGQQTAAFGAVGPGTGLHHLVLTRKVGGIYELWVDGISQGTQTNATSPATSRAHDLHIGRRGNNSSSVLGTYLISYVWQRALTDAEIIQLHADPFGPIRPSISQRHQVSPTSDAFQTKVFVP